ncbi:MAG: hypothetical protein Salg2KO_01320 [Salibacteraceae bacterium]
MPALASGRNNLPVPLSLLSSHADLKKEMHYSLLGLFLSLVIFNSTAIAQSQKKIGVLFLSGKVVNESKRGQESTIYIYKNRALVDEFQTTRIGKFTYEMPMQDSVALVVNSDGYVSKTLIISTKIHPARQSKDHVFPFFMDLYPIGRIPSHIDLDRPVGKIKYRGGQFIYDTDFTEESNELLKEFIKERKRMKVREIDN